MTLPLVILAAGFVVATIIAPGVDQWRRRRARRVRFTRTERIAPTRRTRTDRHDVTTPHWTRDPSPRPRRLGDYEARAIAEGEMQT